MMMCMGHSASTSRRCRHIEVTGRFNGENARGGSAKRHGRAGSGIGRRAAPFTSLRATRRSTYCKSRGQPSGPTGTSTLAP